MASGLPQDNKCCDPCDTAADLVGPKGDTGATGAAGATGTNGVNAYTVLTAGFTQPASGANVVIAAASTAWMVATENLYIAGGGYYEIQSIASAVSATIKNLGYTENVAPTTAVANGQKVVASGVRGATGATGISTLNGVSPTTTKGDIIVDNGANSPNAGDIRFGVGTDGKALVADSTTPSGLNYKTITPNTSAVDRQIAVANGTAVAPMPLQFAPMVVTSAGDLQTTGGNARGVNAVDLQTQRAAVVDVASGARSVIGGGISNKASGVESAITGGQLNIASGDQSAIGGGQQNVASNLYSAVLGGSQNQATGAAAMCGSGTNNTASGDDSAIPGGQFNTASQTSGFVGGGNNNTASGINAAIGGGANNAASGVNSAILAGGNNIASGPNSVVTAGDSNTASGENSSVPGGLGALADKFGQVAHSGFGFADRGDAQTAEYVFGNATTDGTQTELFLDGTAVTNRAFINASFAWCFSGILIGRRSNGDCAVWKFEGGIKNNAGTVSLIGTCTPALIMADAGCAASWGVAGSIVVDADNGNKTLRPRVTGAAANNIRWVAHVRTVETKY